MYGNNFRNFNHMDCKIIGCLKLKKMGVFAPCVTRSQDFESSWLKLFFTTNIELKNFNVEELN